MSTETAFVELATLNNVVAELWRQLEAMGESKTQAGNAYREGFAAAMASVAVMRGSAAGVGGADQ